MIILEMEDFIKNYFHELIQAENLQVLFATYKEVHGHKDGLVATGNDKLKVVVLNGNHEYSSALLDLTSISNTVAIMKNDMDRCREAQDLVEGCFADAKQSLSRKEKTLIFVYVGLVAFDESILFARKARQDFPHAKIVVLTCDCSREKKERDLGRIDDIDYAIIVQECGGRGEMKKLLDYIISNWKSIPIS